MLSSLGSLVTIDTARPSMPTNGVAMPNALAGLSGNACVIFSIILSLAGLTAGMVQGMSSQELKADLESKSATNPDLRAQINYAGGITAVADAVARACGSTATDATTTTDTQTDPNWWQQQQMQASAAEALERQRVHDLEMARLRAESRSSGMTREQMMLLGGAGLVALLIFLKKRK